MLAEFRRVVGNGQIYVDARNVKDVRHYDVPRIRGEAKTNGTNHIVYDSISLCDNDLYEVGIVVREEQKTDNQRVVFETTLRYRQNIKDAIIRMAPDIGLSVDSCFISYDLGEAFDSIIMSSIR